MSANVWRRKDLLIAFKLQASENLTAAVLMFGISSHPNVYHSKLERSFYQRCTVDRGSEGSQRGKLWRCS